LERRKQEELREEANAVVTYNKQFDLKTSWERSTDKKIERNTVQRRVKELLQHRDYSLQERRDKLRDLLQREEKQYITELASKKETVLERQARMRERAKQLRDKREAERIALVENKLEQRWRGQCEELRAVLTKRHQDEVCLDRAEQLRMKQEAKQREQEEEQMYARLWEEDQAAKCKREEIEAAMQIERNREMLKVLTLQMAAVEKQKEEMRELKEKEAQLLREENALRAMEERREKEEKRRRQSETKCDLDYSLKLKMKKKTREIQEELALDMKLLEQMLQETSNEAMLHLQKKNTLKEEIQLYRSYLAEAKREERQREQELDSLLSAEVEKQWAKRTQQWRKEREARRKLMDDVLKTRRQQIKEKLAELEEEKKAAAVERDTLIANYKQHLQIEKEQQESRRKANTQYQASLRDQMAYQQRRAQQEAAKMFRELEMAAREEALYQERLKAALSNPMLDKAHPRKLMATRK
jgi:hypothetical protein